VRKEVRRPALVVAVIPLCVLPAFAQSNPPSRFVFYHLDHLGSPRLELDDAGNVVAQHHFLPFGEERPPQIDPSLSTRNFTGHERDKENGLDYMLARYYSSSLARFMSPDSGVDTDLADPQSWNKYVYTGNNPLKYTDPNGKFKVVGEYRHQNISRAAVPQPQHVRAHDVITGNRRADTGRIFNNNEAAHIKSDAATPTGSGGDSRVQAGAESLKGALQSLAGGDTKAAGQALGASQHSFQDLVGHGGVTVDQHYSEANGGNVDSADSPGFGVRYDAATELTGQINQIFNDAAAAILAGGDVDTIAEDAQRSAVQAAGASYNDTKAKLEQSGQKPEGY